MLEALGIEDDHDCCWVGKIPSQGDFTSHNLSSHSRERLLSWLSNGLKSASSEYGQNTWINIYLNAPIWHFVAAGKQQDEGVAGIIVPSFDNVNRLYPLLMLRGCAMASAVAGNVELFFPIYAQLHELFVKSGVEPHPNSQTRGQMAAYYKMSQSGNHRDQDWLEDQWAEEQRRGFSQWWVQPTSPDERPEPRAVAIKEPAQVFALIFSNAVPYPKQEDHHYARGL